MRDTVWDDLVRSRHPLLVAGYSSIDRIVALVADRRRDVDDGEVRLLLGAEPFPTSRRSFAAPDVAFTEEVRRYWLEERGISLHLSAKVLQAVAELDAGRLTARFVDGHTTLHAKIYVGDDAATVGSSNFTDAGLGRQLEANARFERSSDSSRFDELHSIAEHLWHEGQAWDDQLRALLESMLRVVSWQEALARACAELLEGEWADRYLRGLGGAEPGLWPSQRAGIAQALWIAENVGSVLVADATGSGKTRMGAHLVRAMRDRLWSTGRVRRDLTVLVCPPAVEDTWRDEAISCGLSISTVSHGLLSRRVADGTRLEQREVRNAQILAVDEAHNFLNRDANRTQQVRESHADHVALFTATPINRGAGDLLHLVGLLGADNFEDATLSVLKRLERARSDIALSADEVRQLRTEIQRFTVRRTKSALNGLVDREPDAYAHPTTGRICRYPRHDSHVYPTGETATDEATATEIRDAAFNLCGVTQLERHLHVPPALRRDYTDERWLQFRVASSAGLATHHVLSAMRSSRAALIEHLLGTAIAAERFGIDARYKSTDTGNVLAKLDRLSAEGPPRWDLTCAGPDWLTDADAWRAKCADERRRFDTIAAAAARLSDARERAKAELLARLAKDHSLVLAFDRHLVTLSVLEAMLVGVTGGHRVIVATGSDNRNRNDLKRVFARTSTELAIALCSDAMNEGLNLQGASAIVHLDLPTTLRVAEQRVGRVDRMEPARLDRGVVARRRPGVRYQRERTAPATGRRERTPSGLEPPGSRHARGRKARRRARTDPGDGVRRGRALGWHPRRPRSGAPPRRRQRTTHPTRRVRAPSSQPGTGRCPGEPGAILDAVRVLLRRRQRPRRPALDLPTIRDKGTDRRPRPCERRAYRAPPQRPCWPTSRRRRARAPRGLPPYRRHPRTTAAPAPHATRARSDGRHHTRLGGPSSTRW